MSKKMFVLIVALMSISLIGIIAVQLYWINNAVESKKEQFENDVIKSLGSVTQRINESEQMSLDREYEGVLQNKIAPDEAQIKNFLFQEIDTINNQKFTYGGTILEENFKMPTDFLDNDTIIIKRITSKNDFSQSTLIKGPDNLFASTDEKRYSFTRRLKNIERSEFAEFYKNISSSKPIHQRLSNRELNATIKDELQKRGINLNFKYGVYTNDGLATKLKSGYYTINTKESYEYPLFLNFDNNPKYLLYVTFPTKNKHILSGISGILLLSLFFIFIIIIAFSSSLYQLIQQKKISEVKTDFINNMTHEFKTPIATINLALDSIKNPKIINDNDKVKRYIKMIRDENKRMHTQVENVLRISKLEKNQIDISKETIDMHDIIEEAISHVDLLVKDRGGEIKLYFKAIVSEISGNEFHLKNGVVNMLENAIKYSKEAPKIDVFTESTNKFFVIKIKDEGIGMSKNAQKYVFDKFYREQKGNIHDVKGHGLGLAYVKEIVDKHHGTVFVESEKGKGSIFTVKLPLI
ncbi:sensor histidine kinase [Polaribacter porphyrae]|uniref:histidine kinase n=1 Tax=Polaribacter porphyrae TaxID=1137780 RepID=A0A2S7WLK9_9FLAO|nr:HAMP domain-containing sensor histidine kinase [Polaribacter porphyrae]PQJ78494.1 two-component sensor histidine kinase [Polaribacter porphyrae]